MTANSTRVFQYALLITLLIKFILAAVIPLSGDEAYFVVWARHLDFGYYDHPPMVGWFLHLLLYLGSSEVVLRLPAILTSTLIGIGIYRLLKPYDMDKAALVATLFILSPLNVLNVLITTDTPLLLFAFFSMAALFKALQRNAMGWYVLAGVFFGLGFLSKYFAVLLGLSYLLYWLFTEKSWEKTRGFALLFAASFPFALVNIYWNYTHCWDNILFNLYTRNEDAQLSLRTVAMYAGMLLYLITPPLLWFLLKRRSGMLQLLKERQFQIFLFVFVVPLSVFALLSLKKSIGLHWALAFFPAIYLLAFAALPRPDLVRVAQFMAGFTLLHLLAIIVLAMMPLESWKNHRLYGGMVFMFEPEQVVAQIRPYDEQQFLLATDGYSPSATISYHYGKNFFVFGDGARYARQDDMLTDFRQFNGRNILILSKSAPEMQNYTPYFGRIEKREFAVRDTTFHIVLGYDFNFEKYRAGVLRPVKDKYYKIPDWLPHAPCYFYEKYFAEEHK